MYNTILGCLNPLKNTLTWNEVKNENDYTYHIIATSKSNLAKEEELLKNWLFITLTATSVPLKVALKTLLCPPDPSLSWITTSDGSIPIMKLIHSFLLLLWCTVQNLPDCCTLPMAELIFWNLLKVLFLLKKTKANAAAINTTTAPTIESPIAKPLLLQQH